MTNSRLPIDVSPRFQTSATIAQAVNGAIAATTPDFDDQARVLGFAVLLLLKTWSRIDGFESALTRLNREVCSAIATVADTEYRCVGHAAKIELVTPALRNLS